MYSETKKKTPNMASATRSMTRSRPRRSRFLKSERSSIGTRWCSSSSTNAVRPIAATAKQAEDPRRGPAVRVRLDQRVDEREQPDRRT